MLRCFSEGVAVNPIPSVANQVFFFSPPLSAREGGRGEKVSVVKRRDGGRGGGVTVMREG